VTKVATALAILSWSPDALAFPEFEADDAAIGQQACNGGGCWTNYMRIDDLNGDGHLDLTFANYSGFFSQGSAQELAIYFNDGSGNFPSVSGSAVGGFTGRIRQVAVGDIDNDGDLDMYAPDGWSLAADALFVNDGDGNFTDEASSRLPSGLMSESGGARFADVDNDGDLDLMVAHDYNGNSNTLAKLYLNDGTGVFTDASNQLPSGYDGTDCDDVDMIDIDGDFDLDVLFNMHAGDNNLWENDGNGNFTDVSDQFPGQPNQFHYNPGVCDVDNDGDLINDGSGNFADETSARVSGNNNADDNGVACVDYDHDGDFDAVVWSLSNVERLLENDGSGNFTLVSGVFSSESDPTLWGDFGDFDGDGKLDAATGQGEGNPERNLVYMGSAEAVADTLAPSVRAQETLEAFIGSGDSITARFAMRDAFVSDSGARLRRAFARVNSDTGEEEFAAMFMGGDLYRVVIPGQQDGVLNISFCGEDWAGNIGCGDAQEVMSGPGGADTDTDTDTDTATDTSTETTDPTDSDTTGGSSDTTDGTDSTDGTDTSSNADDGDGGGGGCNCSAEGDTAPMGVLALFGLLGLRRRKD
jgi:MYXO-CTERM domain-containing protein